MLHSTSRYDTAKSQTCPQFGEYLKKQHGKNALKVLAWKLNIDNGRLRIGWQVQVEECMHFRLEIASFHIMTLPIMEELPGIPAP
jgi:hypothetical protein